MTTKTISLKVWENNNLTLLANQGEVNSRYIEASFKNQSDSNIPLSGKTVTFYALKPDGTKIFNNCEINTSSNTATVMLTSQMSATEGVLECEFQIFDSNNVLLKANGIKIIVSSKGDFSEAIESTSEFNALTSAINEANSFSDSVGDISNLNTITKTSVVAAINEVNTKVIPISRGGTGGQTALQARSNLGLKKEYVLYSNESGSQSTITLSDSYKNYDNLVIYYALFNLRSSVVLDVSSIISSSECCLSGGYSDISATKLSFKTCILAFSNSSVTFKRNYSIDISTSPSVSYKTVENVSVLKISGYKN